MNYNFPVGSDSTQPGQMNYGSPGAQSLANPTLSQVSTGGYSPDSIMNFGAGFASPNVAAGDGMFSSGSMYGNKDQMGWLSGGAAVGSSLLNAYLGLGQLSEAKKNNAANRASTNANYEAQSTLTNGQLRDRQQARINQSGGTGKYASVESYMAQNGVKEGPIV